MSNLVKWSRWTLDFAIEQWFLLAMGILIMLAHFFPNVGRRGGSVRSEYTVNYLAVAIIFFISGLSLPFPKLVKHAKNLRLHLIVQVYAFLFTSAVFYGIAAAASTNPNISTSVLVGLIATGCLPTTISSNVTMTGQAGGDVAATMVSVAVSNLIGPFITPLLIARLYLPSIAAFQEWVPTEAIDNLSPLYRSVMMQTGLSVYVPLAVGQVVRALFTETVSKIVTKWKLGKVGQVMLLLLIWYV
jgi:sodium/bile acid cotransporter 7